MDGTVKVLTYSIFRSAAHYARVTQPSEKLTGANNFTLNILKFSVNPFKITSEGIVYVADSEDLAKVPEHLRLERSNTQLFLPDTRKYILLFRLNISWIKNEEIRYEEVDVRVVPEPTPTCGEFKEKNDWLTCASFKKAKQCNNKTACGLGTGGSTSYNLRYQFLVIRFLFRIFAV